MQSIRLKSAAGFLILFAWSMILVSGCGYDSDIALYDNEEKDVFISSPEDGSAYPQGTAVLLEGATADTLTPDTFAWFSDRDGYLGGDRIIETERLSAGTHVIEFLVYGNGLELGKMDIRITIYP